MALSNQYYQETSGNQRAGAHQQDPTKRFTKEAWRKKFAVFDNIRDQITSEDEKELDQAVDTAVREVRAETSKTYGKTPA
jgi:hypothetical protein